MSQLLDNVVLELSKLPSIGRRTALRLAMHLLKEDVEEVEALSEAIETFRREIRHCSRCNNLSDTELCPICSDPSRDRTTVCIVENVGDVLSIENTRQYNGLYHVLGGVISPMQGISPSDLKIDLLVNNIASNDVHEVIMAISTSIEGETTQFYITRRLEQFPELRITSFARGIGFADEIEYADEITISHALKNRLSIK